MPLEIPDTQVNNVRLTPLLILIMHLILKLGILLLYYSCFSTKPQSSGTSGGRIKWKPQPMYHRWLSLESPCNWPWKWATSSEWSEFLFMHQSKLWEIIILCWPVSLFPISPSRMITISSPIVSIGNLWLYIWSFWYIFLENITHMILLSSPLVPRIITLLWSTYWFKSISDLRGVLDS